MRSNVSRTVAEMDIARLYTDACASFDELVRSLDGATYEVPVPCTPGWSVHDVVAHVAGSADDITSGRVEGAGGDNWTAAQVERCRDRSVGELLDAWRSLVPEVAGLLAAFDERRPPIDVHTHEHDVRQALGMPDHHDSEIVRIAADMLVGRLGTDRAVRVEWPDGGAAKHVPLGDAGEALVLRGVTPFEVFRSRLGRRSRRQVAAYDWSADPGDVLDAWFSFGPAASDIDEP